jgi:tetratricopeptide (TPR) repeat protein
VDCFQKALLIDPNQVEALHNLALALVSMGRYDEAIGHYRKALALRPELALIHHNLGVALFLKGDRDQAKKEFAQAGRLDPNWLSQANREAWTRATDPDAGARSGALAEFLARQCCKATHDQVAQFLDTLAAAQAELGQFTEAAGTARRALILARQQQPDLVTGLEERLRLYEAGKPVRSAPGQ